jgi:hypothetical protein
MRAMPTFKIFKPTLTGALAVVMALSSVVPGFHAHAVEASGRGEQQGPSSSSASFDSGISLEIREKLTYELNRLRETDGISEVIERLSSLYKKSPAFRGEMGEATPMEMAEVDAVAAKILERHFNRILGEIRKQVERDHAAEKDQPAFKATLDRVFSGLSSHLFRTRVRNTLRDQLLLAFQMRASRVSSVPVLVAKDNAKPIDADKARQSDFYAGTIETEWTRVDDLQQDKPSNLRRRNLGAGLIEFGKQSTYFNIPMFFIVLAELGVQYPHDPLAYERFIDSLKDPAAHVGFAAFMATNHELSFYLSQIMNGKISRHFIPYIGMSAGMIVSSAINEMWHDKDVHRCAKSFFKDIKSCDAAFETWVPSNKIAQYTPSLLSLISSTILSGVVQQGASAGVKSAANGFNARFGGLKMISKTAARAANLGRIAAGPVSSIGSFFVFLAFDHFINPSVMTWWSRMNTADFDFGKFLRDYTGLGLFERSVRYALFGKIKLPLMTDLTTLKASQEALINSIGESEKSQWLEPNLKACFATGSTAEALWMPGKTRDCLLANDLIGVLGRYAETNKKWRQVLLSDTIQAEASWRQALFRFTVLFVGSYTIYRDVINGIHNERRGTVPPGQEPVDLSLQALGEKLKQAVPVVKPVAERTDDEREALDNLHPKFAEGGFAYTPELLDYMLAQMACGPQAEAKPNVLQQMITGKWLGFGHFKDMPEPTTPVLATPLGSSFTFTPPNITSGDGSICQIKPRIPEELAKKETAIQSESWLMDPQMTHKAGWYDDESGKFYSDLFDYVKTHVRSDLVRTEGIYSGFEDWWDDQIATPTETIWAGFRTQYQKFLKEKFFPQLVKRKLRSGEGCNDSNADICGDSGVSDKGTRISLGVFQSMELEIKGYLQVLLPIYLDGFKEVAARERARGAFLAKVKELVADLREREERLEDGESFDTASAQAKVAELMKMMEQSIEANSTMQDEKKNETRKNYLASVTVEVSKHLDELLKEREDYRRMLTVLDFAEQDLSKTPAPKKGGMSPMQRTGSH